MPNPWTGKGNPYSRQEVRERLHATVERGSPIIAAGAGTGISAKFIEQGGADLIIVYNSGRFRMAGHGSTAGLMSYGDANAIAMDIGEHEVLPVVEEVPVICGVHATDPRRRMWHWLLKVKEMGFSGVNNFSTHTIVDSRFRQVLEETGMSVRKEFEMIALASKMDLFSIVYVSTPEESRAMAEAGADAIIAHVGTTVGGSIGVRQAACSMEQAIERVRAVIEAAKSVRRGLLFLCHGGPIAAPEDAVRMLEATECVGFVGASSLERLAVEQPLAEINPSLQGDPPAGRSSRRGNVTAPGRIYAIATMDTKGRELAFVADCIRACGLEVVTVDVGTRLPAEGEPDIPRDRVAASIKQPVLSRSDRGEAVTAMSSALVAFLSAEFAAGRVAGAIGLGGGGGTALICPAFRALPIGLPKLMVSTMASGNTQPYVGSTDIAMMYSVVDVAGLNSVSRRILANAAHAIAGMVRHFVPIDNDKPTLGMTMFGVTTPCVDGLRRRLEGQGFNCLVFHATGSGDRAMEDLVRSGLIQGVIDVTTTAVADEVVGGVLAAGSERFDAILEAGIPYVISVGALDMVNFGAKSTVPSQFLDRRLHGHNAQVTLMRTTIEENRRIAAWIAHKLNRGSSAWTLLIPERGISAIDAAREPFWDPDADRTLFDELESRLVQTPKRSVKRLPHHINDDPFIDALASEFLEMQGYVSAAGSASKRK